MHLKYITLSLIFCLHFEINMCTTESITYFSTERPKINWYDTKFFKNGTILSRRLSRKDPRYYVEVYVHSLVTITNDLKMDIYFYQFLSNRYRPSFVEMHFSYCDMYNSDLIFGQTIRNALGGRDCPIPPGIYHMKNMSIPSVPKSFPFNKGRIYCNISHFEDGVKRLIAWGNIDMEVKVAKINKT